MKVKYDTSTTVKCPECNEDIQVGTAGPAGIIQHQGKKPCIKAREAKKEKGRLRTLFQVGVKKVQILPAAASKGSDNSNQAQQPEPGPKGCELGRRLIAELRMAAEQLGEDVPIATESDEISAFGRATAEANCMGVARDEVWETVNEARPSITKTGVTRACTIDVDGPEVSDSAPVVVPVGHRAVQHTEPLNRKIHLLFLKLIALDESF